MITIKWKTPAIPGGLSLNAFAGNGGDDGRGIYVTGTGEYYVSQTVDITAPDSAWVGAIVLTVAESCFKTYWT
jgi:hypothetical protein